MGIIKNSLGVEQIDGPYDVTTEMERSLERADFGFIHYTKVPFNKDGLVAGIADVEFGKDTIILGVEVIATEALAGGMNVGLDKVFEADSFTADHDGLVASGTGAAGTIVTGTGALIGDVLSVRTKLTMGVLETGAGYILIRSMGGSDYFDNVNKGAKA